MEANHHFLAAQIYPRVFVTAIPPDHPPLIHRNNTLAPLLRHLRLPLPPALHFEPKKMPLYSNSERDGYAQGLKATAHPYALWGLGRRNQEGLVTIEAG